MFDVLAFNVSLRKQFKPSYDADNEVLSLALESAVGEPGYLLAYFRTGSDYPDQRFYEPVGVTQSATSTHVGATGFGVKENVRKLTERVCGVISASDTGSVGWVDSDRERTGPGDVGFPLSSSDAQRFIKQPGMLLIGKLESPFYLVGGLDFDRPTRDKADRPPDHR
jgi:hypothetical protein